MLEARKSRFFLKSNNFNNFSIRERIKRKLRFDFRRVLHEKNVVAGREFIWLVIINFTRAISYVIVGNKKFHFFFFFFAETRTSPLTIATKREFKSIIGLCDILFIQPVDPFLFKYVSFRQSKSSKVKRLKKKI